MHLLTSTTFFTSMAQVRAFAGEDPERVVVEEPTQYIAAVVCGGGVRGRVEHHAAPGFGGSWAGG
jgi:hypothetical protein